MKRTIERYINELTFMQTHGGISLLYVINGIDDSSEYYDVYLSDTGLSYVTNNTNDDRAYVTTTRPKQSIKIGRITTVKDIHNYEGSETQRKYREEIRDILETLDRIGVVA
jgi:hypothetical protein